MTETARKQAARKFVEYWTFQRGSEKGEDQQFWNSLLGEVLDMADVKARIKYQVPVLLKDTTKFLDAWIPETRVLIEHKSRGVNLDAPQTGHGGLTPYEQAVEYDNARAFDEKARWIVTCNFDEFRIYDRAKPLAPPMKVRLGDLPKEAHRLAFLVNPKEKAIDLPSVPLRLCVRNRKTTSRRSSKISVGSSSARRSSTGATLRLPSSVPSSNRPSIPLRGVRAAWCTLRLKTSTRSSTRSFSTT